MLLRNLDALSLFIGYTIYTHIQECSLSNINTHMASE